MFSEVIKSVSPHREELRGKKKKELSKIHIISSSDVYYVMVEPWIIQAW